MLWLAVLNLGSLRSPFVPDACAWVGTIWLTTLLLANLNRPTVPALGALAVLLFALSQVFDGILLPGQTTPVWMLSVTLAIQVVALTVNGWVIWQSVQGQRDASRPVTPDLAHAHARPTTAEG